MDSFLAAAARRTLDVADAGPAPTADNCSPLDDPDLVFQVCTMFSVYSALRAALCVSRVWRAAALRPDLPLWRSCSRDAFYALEAEPTWRATMLSMLRAASPSRLCRRLGWCCEAVERLLRSKRLLETLDLSQLHVSRASAAGAMARAMPAATALHTLVVGPSNQPDALLQQLVEHLPSLPRLSRLDLRGVLTERTLAGMALLRRRKEDHRGAAGLACRLPSLERLSVGFHVFTGPAVAREGLAFLAAQAR
jgi:hypothetical protein